MNDKELIQHFQRVSDNCQMLVDDMNQELKENPKIDFAVQTILIARRESKLAKIDVYQSAIKVLKEEN